MRPACGIWLSAWLVGCAAATQAAPRVSPVDTRVRLQQTQPVSATNSQFVTAYRKGFGRVMYSDCEMLPSDSQQHARWTSQCNPVAAIFLTSARMQLEVAAAPNWLGHTVARGKLRWLDLAQGCDLSDTRTLALPSSQPPTPAPVPLTETSCEPTLMARCERQLTEARRALREGRAFEAYGLTSTVRVLCPCHNDGMIYWNGWALQALDDVPSALAMWQSLAGSPLATEATLARAWTLAHNADTATAAQLASKLPAATAQRFAAWQQRSTPASFQAMLRQLPNATQAREAARHQAAWLRATQTKAPWAAGTLSALLPGAGQLYAGSIESAALSMLLNGLLIATTVELADRKLYATAATAGTVASVFYIGGILNAIDLARRRNAVAAAPHATALQHTLLPELRP